MNSFFTIMLVGISLSMDAFSLALIYGTQGLNIKEVIILSLIVGVFHFFMPLFGLGLGNIFVNNFEFNFNYLVSIILSIIGLEMIVSSFRGKKIELLDSLVSYLLFGLSVSIDSFTTGIGINVICDNYFIVSLVFMLCSSLFTWLGLKLGSILNLKFGSIATIFGGIILLGLSIVYLFK